MRALVLTGIALAAAASLAAEAKDGARGAYGIPLERQREIEMALSAGPEHLRSDAGLFVLGPAGYERVRESRNGFNCLVERSGPGIVAPICFDREGSETLMGATFRDAELVLSGKSIEEAARIVESEFASGELKTPRKMGIAYMLSSDFFEHHPETGEVKNLYPPHVMFYAPYAKNSDLGLSKDQIGSPKHPWILNEGKPGAYVIVVPQP